MKTIVLLTIDLKHYSEYSMGIFKLAEIKRIEKKYNSGISSSAVVELFTRKKERFSEPTLRKYVQLGLLPKSKRIGTRGRHRGSAGLYPVGVVRQIAKIKEELDKGATLEEIRLGTVGLAGEIATLERTYKVVHARFQEAIKVQRGGQAGFRRTLGEDKKRMQKQLSTLKGLAAKLNKPSLYD